MSNPSARKGAAWESDCITYLREQGFKHAERRVPTGLFDRGDVAGIRNVVIEAKNCAKFEPGSFTDQAIKEANNAIADIGVAFVKRRGKGTAQGYALTDIETMVRMLRFIEDMGGMS